MASVAYDSPPLDPAKISTLGLVYSRFHYNGLPEFSVAGGPFQLEVDDGIPLFPRLFSPTGYRRAGRGSVGGCVLEAFLQRIDDGQQFG